MSPLNPLRPVRPAHAPGRRRRTFMALVALAVVGPALALTAPSASAGGRVPAARASLEVTPDVYVPGQAVRFRGNLGRAGVRTVRLQSHMNRPGDTWREVPDSSFRTTRTGAFDHTFPAPAMLDISYRVAGGGTATAPELFNARPQEITLAPEGRSAASPFHEVLPLVPFTVVADTTPEVRSALGTPPAIPGRTVLLQERVDSGRWRTIDQGRTDAEGHARFTVAAPLRDQRVLRARQERWTAGRNAIGWYASFPAYFTLDPLPSASASSGPASAKVVDTSRARPTASERYRWGASLFDFAWERGQDLASPPSKGTRRRGTWVDTSDGTGRATPFNGGLVLQSKLKHIGPGDRGTSVATLTGNSQRTGRWEFRLQGHTWESGARPFRFLLELVPAGSELIDLAACSPRSVVVADVTMGSAGLAVGVRSQEAGAQWRRGLGELRLAERPFNVAVEVAAGHTTWFVDGRPVATVQDRGAFLDAPLVPRYRLVGGDQEMDGAQVDSDWQRAWPLDGGRQVSSGPALARSAYEASC